MVQLDDMMYNVCHQYYQLIRFSCQRLYVQHVYRYVCRMARRACSHLPLWCRWLRWWGRKPTDDNIVVSVSDSVSAARPELLLGW